MRSVRPLLVALACALAACSTTYREVDVDLGEGEGSHGTEDQAAPVRKFRFSVAAMQTPESTFDSYAELFARVGHLLGVDIELVLRRTYREVDDLLLDGELDAALVCTGGYLHMRRKGPERIQVLAVPVVRGETNYHSLILVPASSDARRVEDLEGKRFAFTDELSLSGRLYPVHLLRAMGKEPGSFFGSTMFTHNHDRAMEALTNGIADGIAVDSLVYEARRASDPELIAKTRIIHRSPPLGIPPIVASTAVPQATRNRLRAVLMSLDRDPDAAAMLRAIHIDRFVAPPPGLYDEAATIAGDAR